MCSYGIHSKFQMFACFNCLISPLLPQLYQQQAVLKRVSQSKAELWFWSSTIWVATMCLAPLKYMSFLTQAGVNCFSCTMNDHIFIQLCPTQGSLKTYYRCSFVIHYLKVFRKHIYDISYIQSVTFQSVSPKVTYLSDFCTSLFY